MAKYLQRLIDDELDELLTDLAAKWCWYHRRRNLAMARYWATCLNHWLPSLFASWHKQLKPM